MKTILLEVEDKTYQTILDFIKLLPENRCRVLNEDELSTDEQQHINHCLTQIEQGDYSEFEDWETVKKRL
jgi:trans-2-enoyl-CoA reductase